MRFDQPLQKAALIRRYKRFLADVELPDGSQMTLHCPNTGSMKNCLYPGYRVWYSDSGNPKRKYPCTWHFIEDPSEKIIGINTGLANMLVKEAIDGGHISELKGYEKIRSEVPYGGQRSRIDFLLSENRDNFVKDCYVVLKNVSLAEANGQGLFPDAVTTRGQKHLKELLAVTHAGNRAVLLFCVQHEGIDRVAPADDIDPEYGRLLREVAAAGVQVVAYRTRFDMEGSRVDLMDRLPVAV
jgi:sugar fermentation stimulation protein A